MGFQGSFWGTSVEPLDCSEDPQQEKCLGSRQGKEKEKSFAESELRA